MKIYGWLLVCLVLAGCLKQQPKLKKIDERALFAREMIAKFSDIPDAPLQVTLESLQVSQDQHQMQAVYTMMMTAQDVVNFYEQQMEWLGWEEIAQSTLQDIVVHYRKPGKMCSIVVTGSKLSIYLCTRKGV